MQAPIASMFMYDWPEISPAIDIFWSEIKSQLGREIEDIPEELTRDVEPIAHWKSPYLLMSQTCGWPYANLLSDSVTPFARFDYGLEHSDDGYYYSVFVSSSPDISLTESDNHTIAVNSHHSQSGFHVFKEHRINPLSEEALVTGSHRESILSVANGETQLAAIDAVCFELAKRYEPEAISKLHVLGFSEPRPGLPLITSRNNQAYIPHLYKAIESAIANLDPDTLDKLLIKGVVPATKHEYEIFKTNV